MSSTMSRKGCFTGSAGEQGIALVTALFALLLITLLGLALTANGIVAVTITTNEREGTEALYIAESGIEHAKAIILGYPPPPTDDFDVFLQAGDGIACNGDELSNLNALGVVPLPAPLTVADAIPPPQPPPAPPGGMAFLPGGRYEVMVCDDHLAESTAPLAPPLLPDADPNNDANGLIRVVSTGFGRDNSTATVEIIIRTVPLPAVVTNGPLRINGNPHITGPGGAVHANGILDINGKPCAEDFFSTSETVVDITKGETGSGCDRPPYVGYDSPADIREGEAVIPIPEINSAALGAANADYILGSDGVIRDQAGTIIGDATAGDWNDWSWDPGNKRWVAGNDIPPGTYYAQDSNINISGNPGSGGPPGSPPMSLTLIADGWIEISGNPNIAPDLTIGSKTYSMVAGTDLKISGNPGTTYEGIHYAGHQIGFSGNPNINGQVFANNQDDTPYPNPGGINLIVLDADGFMSISGNPTINYSGTGGAVAVTKAGWRECRGPNPANPCQ